MTRRNKGDRKYKDRPYMPTGEAVIKRESAAPQEHWTKTVARHEREVKEREEMCKANWARMKAEADEREREERKQAKKRKEDARRKREAKEKEAREESRERRKAAKKDDDDARNARAEQASKSERPAKGAGSPDTAAGPSTAKVGARVDAGEGGRGGGGEKTRKRGREQSVEPEEPASMGNAKVNSNVLLSFRLPDAPTLLARARLLIRMHEIQKEFAVDLLYGRSIKEKFLNAMEGQGEKLLRMGSKKQFTALKCRFLQGSRAGLYAFATAWSLDEVEQQIDECLRLQGLDERLGEYVLELVTCLIACNSVMPKKARCWYLAEGEDLLEDLIESVHEKTYETSYDISDAFATFKKVHVDLLDVMQGTAAAIYKAYNDGERMTQSEVEEHRAMESE